MRNSLVGQRFGQWLVESDAGVRRGKRKDARRTTRYWRCRCNCGTVELVRTSGLISGGSTQCWACGNIARAKTLTIPNSGAARTELIGRTKAAAAQRGYNWDLSAEVYDMLTQQPCFYCGSEPMQVFRNRSGIFLYNGVDRIKNERGYTLDNVVPCCGICNQMKSARSKDQFEQHVRKIVRHLEKQNGGGNCTP